VGETGGREPEARETGRAAPACGGIADREIAVWLVSRRRPIEAHMEQRLGPAAPGAGAAEVEVLRRFRSYAAAALQRGEAALPALDGLRCNERRVSALLEAWAQAASELAGPQGERIAGALAPLVQRFRSALRTTTQSRRARGLPRATRRAVMAAIDRVADSFLAVDADSGHIVDANPAAGALLGLARDALLGVDAMSFVPPEFQSGWWTELESLTEGSEPRRFTGSLRDVSGAAIPVDCSITRFATRERTLALILARPC
jgi:PAS domain S-box-containing protein